MWSFNVLILNVRMISKHNKSIVVLCSLLTYSFQSVVNFLIIFALQSSSMKTYEIDQQPHSTMMLSENVRSKWRHNVIKIIIIKKYLFTVFLATCHFTSCAINGYKINSICINMLLYYLIRWLWWLYQFLWEYVISGDILFRKTKIWVCKYNIYAG